MRLVEDLFNLIAAHDCMVCGAEGSLLCPICSGNLPRVVPRCYLCKRWSDDFRTCKSCRRRTPLASVSAFTFYEGSAKDIVHRLKFGRAKATAKTIADRMAVNAKSEATLVTYVPTAASRMRQRGYDQSALIAKELARQIGLPCLPLLVRLGSQRQVGQQREARKLQMKDAFRPLNEVAIKGQRILVIDDVLTTGATCEATARALKRAGAREVHAAVFAVA